MYFLILILILFLRIPGLPLATSVKRHNMAEFLVASDYIMSYRYALLSTGKVV